MKTIYMTGIVGWEITADNIRQDFNSETKEKKRIILNSVGGSVSEGFEIYNILKAYKGEIELVLGAMVASIASYFAMAVPKENRKAFKNSSFMLHEASSIAEGRARDFLTFYERLEGINNIMAEAIGEGLGITREQARDTMREDKFYTGWESLVDNNIISDIIEPKDIEVPKKEEDENQYLFITEMMAELEKQQDVTIAKAKMYECEDKINSDIKKSQADIQKAAAFLKIDETNKAIIPADSPDENIIQEDKKMKLMDYLETDPEAKADFEAVLETAKAQVRTEMTNALNQDRQRLGKVLELEGVSLSEVAAQAIEGEMSIENYMEARIKGQLDKRSEKKESPFKKLVSPQLPGDQDEKGKAKAKGEIDYNEFDKQSAALADKVIPGGKK
jgi:ATP-dependent Clp protease protease subunit